jgi:hypothetical protein
MNEEDEVLEFFAQPENLSLALTVAEQVDAKRQKLNHEFWVALSKRLIDEALPDWFVITTENRNKADNEPETLVGVYLQPNGNPAIHIRPMMEQQYMGENVRVYFGLMWSDAPSLKQKSLPEIVSLQRELTVDGFKNSDSFLAWQWTTFYPRSMDFLLRFTDSEDSRKELLEIVVGKITTLLVRHGEAIQAANAALQPVTRTLMGMPEAADEETEDVLAAFDEKHRSKHSH